MKKKLFALLLVLATVFTLASCDYVEDLLDTVIPPKDADELYERVDDRMDSLASYRADTSGTMKFYASGNEVDAKITGMGIMFDDDTQDYYYYNYMKTEITSEDLDLDEESESMIAYSGGKAFVNNSGEDYEQMLALPVAESKPRKKISELIPKAIKSKFKKNDASSQENNGEGVDGDND